MTVDIGNIKKTVKNTLVDIGEIIGGIIVESMSILFLTGLIFTITYVLYRLILVMG